MKDLTRFIQPPTTLAEQQALSWIAKITGNTLSLQQEADFAVWLSLDTSHRELFDELTDIWELTGNLPNEALQRIKQETEQDTEQETEHQAEQVEAARLTAPHNNPIVVTQGSGPSLNEWHKDQPSWRFGLPMALSAVAAVLLIWISLSGTPTAELHQTSTGGYAKIALADGSTLHLNTNTKVRVLFTAKARTLQLLSGELFIEVASAPERPLTVYTEGFTATAIGTAFGVAATPAQRWVDVAEGHVLVSSKKIDQYRSHSGSDLPMEQALLAGDKLDFDTLRGFELVKSGTSQAEAASWRGGQLFYRDITLEHLLADLNRYHHQQLVVHDPEIRRVRISAVLNSDDHAGAVAALVSSLGLVSHKIGESVTLLALKK